MANQAGGTSAVPADRSWGFAVRRLVLAVLLVLPGLTLLSAPARAGERVVQGRVDLPSATVARAQRCVETTAPELGGRVGWTIRGVLPGRAFTVTADDSSAVSDFEISFYSSLPACQDSAVGLGHNNVFGDEQGEVPAGATVALVTLHSGQGGSFTYREWDVAAEPAPAGPQGVTVVAVVDGGFNPYHYDFVGSQHPWNLDGDASNDIDFSADPATYISGYPGAQAINLTLPATPDADVATRHTGVDAAAWSTFEASSTVADAKMHWFPGTKVIGAVSFNGSGTRFWGGNDSHGTRSAASAAGNIHGTCAECVFVLVNGATTEALAWAASQPWIDVVTNSYGHNLVGQFAAGVVRDNIWLDAPVEETKAAVTDGQTIVFSAGNGLVNAFDVPMLTYWSSEKGPDWMVTVGAVDPRADQQYSGAGKPVDISSYGSSYPSTGGTTATGVGTHSGTSNAAPVTAGTIARVIQRGRTLLGDTTEGHAAGVVASGTPVACGSANPSCALADGVLTRAEAQQAVFHNVLPSKVGVTADTVWPSTEHAYYYQGHGVIGGRMNGRRYVVEQQRFAAYLTGAVAAFARPAHEQTWMTVDSKCRQVIWGSWSGGYYTGTTPALDPAQDPIASAFNEWCSRSPVTFSSPS